MKTTTLIARICEDFTEASGLKIVKGTNIITLIFDFNSDDVISYRIRKDFYDVNLKAILEDDAKKNKFLFGKEDICLHMT